MVHFALQCLYSASNTRKIGEIKGDPYDLAMLYMGVAFDKHFNGIFGFLLGSGGEVHSRAPEGEEFDVLETNSGSV